LDVLCDGWAVVVVAVDRGLWWIGGCGGCGGG